MSTTQNKVVAVAAVYDRRKNDSVVAAVYDRRKSTALIETPLQDKIVYCSGGLRPPMENETGAHTAPLQDDESIVAAVYDRRWKNAPALIERRYKTAVTDSRYNPYV
jgi:hypothetical protein